MSEILLHNNNLYLSQAYIIRQSGVSPGYLRVAKTRAKKGGQAWKYEVVNGVNYFEYTHIPRSIVGLFPEAQILQRTAIEYNDDISVLVQNAIYIRFKAFSKDLPEDAAKAAAVIHEASAYIKNHGIPLNKSSFFTSLSSEIKGSGLKYLPTDWRNLRSKIQAYINGDPLPAIVCRKNEGNANAAFFSKNETVTSWVTALGANLKNYSGAYIYRKIRSMCNQHGFEKTPSLRWITEYLAKPETQFIINTKYGSNTRHNAKYRGYTPTASALFAGDCWEIDGTRVNIIDHKTIVERNGKKVPANKFLYIVAVRDVMSGLPLGWEYCYQESADVIINALSMAVRNTGYLPYELRYDKFPGHNTTEWQDVEKKLRDVGVELTQTIKPEGKSHIERWWGTLQTVFMSSTEYYYGEGIRSSRKYAHRAKEYVAETRKKALAKGFDFNAACAEADQILHAYSSTKYSVYSRKYSCINNSPEELHEGCIKPNTYTVEPQLFAYLFGLKKELSIRNLMVQTQINNATYYYAVEDISLIERYTGVRILAAFDYEDLTYVHLFDSGNYLSTLKQITPAQQYGKIKDLRSVGTMKKIAAEVEEVRLKKETKAISITLAGECEEESNEVVAFLGGWVGKHSFESAESNLLLEEWSDDEITSTMIKY